MGLLLGGVAASAWALRRVWRQRKAIGPATRLAALGLAFAVAVGTFGTVDGILRASLVIAGAAVDPSGKARALAEGISQAMNCSALAVVVGLPAGIALWVLMRGRGEQSG